MSPEKKKEKSYEGGARASGGRDDDDDDFDYDQVDGLLAHGRAELARIERAKEMEARRRGPSAGAIALRYCLISSFLLF